MVTINIKLVKEIVYILFLSEVWGRCVGQHSAQHTLDQPHLQGSWTAGVHHSGQCNRGQFVLSHKPLRLQPHPFPQRQKGKDTFLTQALAYWSLGPQSPPGLSMHTTFLLLEFPYSPINPASWALKVLCSSHPHYLRSGQPPALPPCACPLGCDLRLSRSALMSSLLRALTRSSVTVTVPSFLHSVIEAVEIDPARREARLPGPALRGSWVRQGADPHKHLQRTEEAAPGTHGEGPLWRRQVTLGLPGAHGAGGPQARSTPDAPPRRRADERNQGGGCLGSALTPLGALLQAIASHMHLKCKCHGLSGSCEVKTCWWSQPDFRAIGDFLKDKYDSASEMVVEKHRESRGWVETLRPRYTYFKVPTERDLVYYEASPNFCEPNPETGSFGTRDRTCNVSSHGIDGCDLLCCGRGHNARTERRREKCHCVFHWCCYVSCQECARVYDVHTCK